jgi:hypothetical protein
MSGTEGRVEPAMEFGCLVGDDDGSSKLPAHFLYLFITLFSILNLHRTGIEASFPPWQPPQTSALQSL